MTTCPLPSSRSIFNNLHWRSQCQLSLPDENFAERTTNHLELSYYTHSCIVMPLHFVVLAYEGTTQHSTNSRLGTSLWLSPVTAPGDIWIPLTEELFSQYATIGSHRYDIPWRISPIFFRCYHLPNLLLYVTKLLQWRATMITSSHEKLVIAPHNHSCQVAHIYNQV